MTPPAPGPSSKNELLREKYYLVLEIPPTFLVFCVIDRADPLYEDPRTEVRRLLDKYHCDRYKVYNFASELAQMTPPAQRVDTRVERCPNYCCRNFHAPERLISSF